MTTMPAQGSWVAINLVARLKTTGATTSFDISSRPVIDESGSYYPILKEISSLGSAMGDFLPVNSTGTITLNNAPNSFGFERRFSDILDRYTIIDQEVTIYAVQEVVTNLAPGIADQAWKGRIRDFTINVDGQTIDINVESSSISQRVATKMIDSTNFPNAPVKSYGQALPIVFGTDIEVKPIQISADGATAPDYAYATTLGNSTSGYINGGVTSYYVKDYDGIYRAITSSAVTTPRNGYTGATANNGIMTTEVAFRSSFASASTDSYLCTGVRVRLLGTGIGAGTVTGTITLRVYEDLNGAPALQPIATATVEKFDYSAAFHASAEFDIKGSLDRPLLFSKSTYYYLSISATNETAATCSSTLIMLTVDGSAYSWSRITTGTTENGTNWKPKSLFYGGNLDFGFYPCLFADTPDPTLIEDGKDFYVNTETGLGNSYFNITQNAAGTGQTNSDLTKLDYVVKIDGLKDNSSGTISGSANYQIVDAKYAILLLDKEWNGTTWTGGRIDSGKFSSYHAGARGNSADSLNRYLSGASKGRSAVWALFGEICKSSASRLVPVNSTSSGKYLGFWAFGSANATAAIITDEEANILSIEQRGVETIVNNVQGSYGWSLTTVDPNRWLIAGASDRLGTMLMYNDLSGVGTMLCAASIASYGQRYLSDNQFDFIGDATSATNLARCIIARYAVPTVYVILDVPFFKYSTLSLLDVIEIVHPDLPAYFGTSSDAHNPTYTGTEVDMRDNLYWKRAQRYRAQIESRVMNFNLGGFPTLRIEARLLLNSPNDPT
jgi:hypothetical protein